MTWEPIARRLSSQTVPNLLAGPILRRVTPTSVSVWLVFRTLTSVQLGIYTSGTATQALFSSGLRNATKVGDSLYVVVVTASTTSPMTPGTVYYYDCALFSVEAGQQSLADAAGTGAVTYHDAPRPSFSLPPASREALRLFHASCRRPGSRGSRDALMIVGDMIADSLDDADGRPHQLFLTGDQIYADDVPDALLLMISDAAMTLVGEENVPFDDSSSVAVLPPPNQRTSLIKKQAKFTTGDTASHLITFGEYLLMYVFVWSEVLWGTSLPAYADLPAETIPEDEGARRKHRKDFDLHEAALIDFRALIGFVRKTLANVPTYMILDDHEVSDDWNLDRTWCEDVYGSALGRRIVTNALLAYALCQHWGNSPEQFDAGAGLELLGLLSNNTMHTSARTATILGLHDETELRAHATQTGTFSLYHDADALPYHYQVVGPHHLVAVTDTRTWRSYPRGGDGYPDLIDPAELVHQLPTGAELGARQLFVILTTNLAPIPPARWAAGWTRESTLRISKTFRQQARIKGEFAESWLPGRVDFFRFLAFLARNVVLGTGSVIVLSGDVHYGFSTRMQYWAQQQVDDPLGTPTQANLVIAQLVSSAANNRSGDSDGYHTQGYRYRTSIMRGWFAEQIIPKFTAQPEAFFGWTPATAIGFPAPVQSREFITDPGGNVIEKWSSLVSADMPSFSDYVPSAHEGDPNPPLRVNLPPHYRLLMDHLVATAGSELPAPYQSDAVDPLVARTDQLNWAVASKIASVDGSRIVGRPNVGEVNLHGSFAHHFLLWRGPSPNYDLHWMRFDASLDPSDSFYTMPTYLGE